VTTLSLVVPVYGNAETIPALLDAVAGIDDAIDSDLELVVVVDGSPDTSLDLLRGLLPRYRYRSVLVDLSRNFGSFAAIREGLAVASGDLFAVMAADLQEPPELVVEFERRLRAGDVDVVLGQRDGRAADPWLTRTTSTAYWWSYRRLVQREMPEGGVDVFGCTRTVRDLLVSFDEQHSSLVGLLVWSGFRRAAVPYERRPRAHGRSGWSLRKRLRYMADSAFSFSDLPIKVLLAVGVLGFLGLVAVAVVVLVAWALGWVDVPGYTPLMLTIVGSTALIVLAQGVVGAYVWRAYENTKGRPLAVRRVTEVTGERSDQPHGRAAGPRPEEDR
jgi:glycosyltransferase involved in cell wall biosynthesis